MSHNISIVWMKYQYTNVHYIQVQSGTIELPSLLVCSVSKSPNVSVTRLKRQSTVENHPKGPNKPQTELILFPMSLYAVFYVTVCRFMCHRFLCHGMPFSMSRFTVFYVTVYRFLCHGMPFSMSRYTVFCHGENVSKKTHGITAASPKRTTGWALGIQDMIRPKSQRKETYKYATYVRQAPQREDTCTILLRHAPLSFYNRKLGGKAALIAPFLRSTCSILES